MDRRSLLAATSLLLCSVPAAAAAPESFERWLGALKAEARSAGVSDKTLEAAFRDVAPIPRVIELDRRQPEGVMTFEQYLARVVTPQRIEDGRRLYAEHRELVEAVGKRHGVTPEFLVALWGVETHFGARTGDFSIVAALATLAHDGRRPAMFRKQLLAALKILERGDVSPERMLGSWAGAMGQCQFMPGTFLAYAVDGDGDGRRDIWGSMPDVFASSANFLKKSGWKKDVPWGVEVRLPEGFDEKLVGRSVNKSGAQWRKLGLRTVGGGALPELTLPASLVRPGGQSERLFLVQGNYHVLLRWNRSEYFATVVSLLADAIASAPGVEAKATP